MLISTAKFFVRWGEM